MRYRWFLILTIVFTLVTLGTVARAQVFSAGHCHTGIPERELTGFTPLPQGEVFCFLIADPKSVHSVYIDAGRYGRELSFGNSGRGNRG